MSLYKDITSDSVSRPRIVVFHDKATVASDGQAFDVKDYKTLTIEIYGTSSSRTVEFKATGESGVYGPITGVNLNGFGTAESTTGTAERWQFEVTSLSSVIMDLTAVAGGNVSVKGRAVA